MIYSYLQEILLITPVVLEYDLTFLNYSWTSHSSCLCLENIRGESDFVHKSENESLGKLSFMRTVEYYLIDMLKL